MAKKAKYLVSTLAALCIAVPVLAAQDPAPPTNLQSEEQIIAWAKAARLTDDTASPAASWSILGALDEGLLWSASTGQDAQGIAKVGIRLERFRPAGGVRSEAEMFDLNCSTQQIRGTFNAAFAEHNFSGAKTDRAVNSAWAPVASNEIVAAVKDDACKAAARTAAASAPGGGAPFEISDFAAARRWATANRLDEDFAGARRWGLLSASNQGLIYTGEGARQNTTRTVAIFVRLERYVPAPHEKLQTVLSETEEYEVNCQNMRLRKMGNVWYTNRNLQGRNDGLRKVEDWAPVASHPVLARPMETLCRDFQPERQMQRGRLRD